MPRNFTPEPDHDIDDLVPNEPDAPTDDDRSIPRCALCGGDAIVIERFETYCVWECPKCRIYGTQEDE